MNHNPFVPAIMTSFENFGCNYNDLDAGDAGDRLGVPFAVFGSPWVGRGSVLELRSVATTPIPSVIIAVVDVSGSMAESAASRSGPSDAHLFSKLDLVKHSLRTVGRLCAEKRAAYGIVTFSDEARTVLPVATIEKEGEAAASMARAIEAKIEGMRPTFGTNIWQGLKLGMEEGLHYGLAHPDANIHVVLLTDGHETHGPPRGLQASTEEWLAACPVKMTLSCFGFGYNLPTKHMEDAVVNPGGGVYGYIPDCTMVGSVFINFCALVFSSVATHVTVDGVPVRGPLLVGGSRTVQLPCPSCPDKKVAGLPTSVSVQWRLAGESSKRSAELLVHATEPTACLWRHKLWSRLTQALAAATLSSDFAKVDCDPLLKGMPQTLAKFAHKHPVWASADAAFLSDLAQDLASPLDCKGQLGKACSALVFPSWGLNYLVAFNLAVQSAACANFKDATLQTFAPPEFNNVRSLGDSVFAALPAPRPSRARTAEHFASASSSLASYNTAEGGCWSGGSLITMHNGSRKCARDIMAGEVVQGGATVVCVVRAPLQHKKLVTLCPGLSITPWHPVRRRLTASERVRDGSHGSWTFPAYVGEVLDAGVPSGSVDGADPYVYTLVLDAVHFVTCGDFDVCTLGHGMTGKVIGHDYYGTQAVIDDLKALPGWDQGLVTTLN